MEKASPGSAAAFTLIYNDAWIKVSTKDHIRFFLEFENGQKKEMAFEVDTNFDLAWTFVPDIQNQQSREIGRLIEKKLW